MPLPKKKPAPKSKRTPWEVIQIRSKGHMLGIVHAESKDEALRLALSDFRIKKPELVKLIVRRIV
jgi:hypothetical protein